MTLDGAFQTWWHGTDAGAPTIYVLEERTSGTYTVERCRISESTCPEDVVWTGNALDQEGSAWLVEQRPQPTG